MGSWSIRVARGDGRRPPRRREWRWRVGGEVEDGVTGIIVPPDDPQALASALDRLATDPDTREAFGRAAFDRVRQRYSLDRMTEATLAVYELAASGRTRAIDRYAASIKLQHDSDEALMLEAMRNARFLISSVTRLDLRRSPRFRALTQQQQQQQ